MTESWQIAWMTILSTLATGLLGWAAATLAGIRKDLNKKVDKDECNHTMDYHCKRLDHLVNDVRQNATAIAELRAALNVLK